MDVIDLFKNNFKFFLHARFLNVEKKISYLKMTQNTFEFLNIKIDISIPAIFNNLSLFKNKIIVKTYSR